MNTGKYRSPRDNNVPCLINVIFGSLVCAFNVFVGAWSVNFILSVLIQQTIPFIAAAAIGLFVAEFTVPVAIVIGILQICGVL